jgi:hypothetical protein
MRARGWGEYELLWDVDDYGIHDARLAWSVWQEAARQEREACAKVCDEFGDDYMQQARGGDQSGASDHKACAATEIADEIRSRS